MCRIKALSVIFFALSCLFAPALNAQELSDQELCGFLKDVKEFKQLYGICIAYQNADEDGKEDLIRIWDKRVSDLGLPPDEEPQLPNRLPNFVNLSCPCWSNFNPELICGLGQLDSSAASDGILFFEDFSGAVQVSHAFAAFEPNFCSYLATEQGNESEPLADVTRYDLESTEAIQCRTEILVMAADDYCN